MQADRAPKARVWFTEAATRDFRKSKWSDRRQVEVDGKDIVAEMTTPEEGFVAFFAELEYGIDGLRWLLSTQLRIAGK